MSFFDLDQIANKVFRENGEIAVNFRSAEQILNAVLDESSNAINIQASFGAEKANKNVVTDENGDLTTASMPTSSAGDTSFTPNGDITSTNVQNAIVEVRDDVDIKLSGKQSTAGKNQASGYAGLDASTKLTGSQLPYGTLENTACQGNDNRLSDSRTPVVHQLDGILHSVAGLTAGHFLKASGATSFGFAAHGLTSSDVGLGSVTNDAQVKGIGSSTDNAIVRWDSTTGKLVQDSVVTIDDTGIKTVSGLSTKESSETVADEGIISLPTSISGWGEVMLGDNEEWASFRFKADGTVTLIAYTTNVVTTDTDEKFCIYDGGSGVIIKNRMSSSKTVRYSIKYSA